MVKKDATAAALSTADNSATSALAAAPQTEAEQLAALYGDTKVEDDGLQEADSDDMRLPVIVWNMKGKDPKTNELRRLDEFYDTLNEVSHRQLRVAFVHLHKTRLFSRFNNDTNENVIYCSSKDGVTGRMREKHPDGLQLKGPRGELLPIVQGTVRDCKTCPDSDWHQNSAGKNIRNCDPVYGIFAAHLDEQNRPTDGFLLRFKRTGLPPLKTHMQKHHLGRRILPNGSRVNVPLYTFACTLTLEISKNGNFATPLITRGEILPKTTIDLLADQAKLFAQVSDIASEAADSQEQRHEAGDNSRAGAGGEMRGDDFVT